MDLKLIPLKIELRIILEFEFKISIWGITFSKKWTLINQIIWQYQSDSINMPILNKGDLEPDTSPPVFVKFPDRKQVKN
jgi:hypothetical protein